MVWPFRKAEPKERQSGGKNILNKKLIFYAQQILNYRATLASIQNMCFLKVNNFF